MLKLFKQNKMFRVLLTYQVFSGLGGGVFSLFMLLSVHLIYRNPIYTGIAGFLMAAPHIFSFAVGPIVDRRNKITIMRLTTFLEFSVLALLAFTPLQESLGVIFMFAVIFAYSIAALFEAPAGTALLPQIVQDEEIMEANSLIQIVSMVGGIAIAAILYTSLGGDIPFRFIYGISTGFLAITFVFSLLLKNPSVKEQTEKSPSPDSERPASNYMRDLKEGARFIRHSIFLYLTIALVIKVFVVEIASVNRPMFLEYHVGAQGYIVFTVMGLLGGIAASFFVGVLGKKFRIGQLLFVLYVFAGAVRIIFVHILPVQFAGGIVTMLLYAALASATGIVYSSLQQKIPPKDMVGRVDTITTTFAAISVTIGALAGGFIGSIVPVVDHIFIFQGAGYIVIGVFLLLVPSIRKLPKMNDIKKADSED